VIPLEIVLKLIDELRAEAIVRAENPLNRDAVELGVVSGMLQALSGMRERLDALVEQSNQRDEE
jgi:hypothetical protein